MKTLSYYAACILIVRSLALCLYLWILCCVPKLLLLVCNLLSSSVSLLNMCIHFVVVYCWVLLVPYLLFALKGGNLHFLAQTKCCNYLYLLPLVKKAQGSRLRNNKPKVVHGAGRVLRYYWQMMGMHIHLLAEVCEAQEWWPSFIFSHCGHNIRYCCNAQMCKVRISNPGCICWL